MDLPVASPSACIHQAAHREPAAIEHVGVDHGGGHVRVAQQFLPRANAITAHQQMRGAAAEAKRPGQRENASNINDNSSLTRFLLSRTGIDDEGIDADYVPPLDKNHPTNHSRGRAKARC